MPAWTVLDLLPEFQEAAPLVAASCLCCATLFAILDRPARSWLRQRRIRHWANHQRNIDALRRGTWQDFEIICGDAFRRLGYSVDETGGGGADDGADLILNKKGQKFLVSCKRYKAKVGVQFVREAVGSAVFHRAKGVYVVALSGFTKDALKFSAKTRNVQLIDGKKLIEILNRKG